jgi:hypothetical protein
MCVCVPTGIARMRAVASTCRTVTFIIIVCVLILCTDVQCYKIYDRSAPSISCPLPTSHTSCETRATVFIVAGVWTDCYENKKIRPWIEVVAVNDSRSARYFVPCFNSGIRCLESFLWEVNFIAVVKSLASCVPAFRTTWNQQDKSRISELIQLIIMHKIKHKVWIWHLCYVAQNIS